MTDEDGTGFPGERLWAGRAATLLNSAVCWLAIPCLIAGWAVWAWSLTPSATSVPDLFTDEFIAATALLLAWTVLVVSGGRLPRDSRRLPADLLKAVSRRMRPLILLALIALVPTMIISMTGPRGAADYDPVSHRYFLDLHGARTPTTRAVYLHNTIADSRVWVSVAVAFMSVALGVCYGERMRRRSLAS